MIVIRRRLIFWLIKAYIKKSGLTILFSFLLGLVIFFFIIFASRFLPRLIPIYKKSVIGLVGAYQENELPSIILDKVSVGLTQVDRNGNVIPELASGWKITNSGKTYIIYIKPHNYFTDNKEVTADTVSYNFSDVTEKKINKYTIEFHLKESYAPFLTTLSQPIFENGLTGVGNYQIENIALNANFVQSLTLQSVTNHLNTIKYQFYPTEDTLKLAFLLGNITAAENLTTPEYNSIQFAEFPHTKISQYVDYSSLVTLFYNTNDQNLSNKILRLALSYAVPNNFVQGVKAYGPYSLDSIYYNKAMESNTQDYVHAKLLLSESHITTSAKKPLILTITTLRKYHETAMTIASAWAALGIQTKIYDTDRIPAQFQVFLGNFSVPKDPDQYTLWHSGQSDNITKYSSIRIDKLLEEGRSTADENQREQIYYNFQKYLMDDSPATFLYFPYVFNLTRN